MAKQTHFTHLILARLEDDTQPAGVDNLVLEAIYFESKFERTIGDKIDYDGKQMVVVVAGDAKDKVVKEINYYIQKQNEMIEIQKKFYATKAGKAQLKELKDILFDLNIKMSK